MQPAFQKVLGDRALQRRYGHEELIGAGADCVYDDLRHVMCDLVQALRLCERYCSHRLRDRLDVLGRQLDHHLSRG